VLHVQVKLPGVLAQAAFGLQFDPPVVHSLMSTQDVPLPFVSVYPVGHWQCATPETTTHVAFGSQLKEEHAALAWQSVPLPFTSTVFDGHLQVNEPGVFVHVATGSQLLMFGEHSFTSVHVTPLPVKPAVQAHVLLPTVFVQSAFALQPPLFVRHSFTSVHAVMPSPV
jgi:hypothetical protein